MSNLRIGFIGPLRGNPKLRSDALRRRGYIVTEIDSSSFVPSSKLFQAYCYQTGAALLGRRIDNLIKRATHNLDVDLFIVNQGEYLGPAAITSLQRIAPVANYMNDDPFGGRDGLRFRRFIKALPLYDLVCVVREPNVNEAVQHGAKKVMRIFMTADEFVDSPREVTTTDRQRFGAKVSFIGSWMPERGPFVARLLSAGVPLAIWGNGWQKSPEWSYIKMAWRGNALKDRNEYSIALQCADVNLCLLSKGNRDEHTTRSLEIPSVGGVLCAERTREHEALYRDGKEAVFWRDVSECAILCNRLLEDRKWRTDISRAARLRALSNNLFNGPAMEHIVEEALRNSQC